MVRKQVFPEVIVGPFIMNRQGKLLLVRSHKWPGVYCVPGGHVELGESIKDTARREAKEEVGLDVQLKSVLNIQEGIYPKGFHKKRHFIFVDALCTVKNDKIRIDNDEIQDYLWVDPKAALRLRLDSYTRVTVRQLVNKEKHMKWHYYG